MGSITTTFLHTLRELKDQGYATLGKSAMRQLYQEWISIGLRRDLSENDDSPCAQIPILIRPLCDQDISPLLLEHRALVGRKENLQIANRLAHLAERMPTCYVAVDRERDVPCFMQWLMYSSSNEQIAHFFGGRFPRLQPHEALLENAYIPPSYRGKGIMPAGMARISNIARTAGCRYVMTFVLRDNTPSLNGCTKAGFRPFMERHDRHLLFHLLKWRKLIEAGTSSNPTPGNTASPHIA